MLLVFTAAHKTYNMAQRDDFGQAIGGNMGRGRTMERPMPLYEYMVLASSLEAALTVMRFPLFNSKRRHCSKQGLKR